MTREELREDLAYVRTLAEEGQQAPLVGGRFLVLFGALLGVAYFLQWAFLTDLFGPVHGTLFLYLWIGYSIVGFAGVFFLRGGVKALPGNASVANRVDRAIWRSCGFAIMVVVIGCMLRLLLAQDYTAPNAIMGAAFALFGVALAVTAAFSSERWLRIFSLLAFATAIVLLMYPDEPWAYLLASIASFTVLALPGIVLMRREPSPIV